MTTSVRGEGNPLVAASLAWISRDTRIRHEAFREYSIYNSSEKGLSIAYRYLESKGRAVAPLARPVARAFLPADGVLLRIRPEADPFKFIEVEMDEAASAAPEPQAEPNFGRNR